MTTKPTKARKFRIKRNAPLASATPEDTVQPEQPPRSQGTAADQLRQAAQASTRPRPAQKPAAQPQPSAKIGKVASASQVAGETDMDAIRREGLTGRQLRMARRVAQKHGLPATSDFDAVRLLREQGIDPFQRSNTIDLVVPQGGAEQHEGGAPDAMAGLPAQLGGAGSGRIQLPQTMQPQKQMLPSTDVDPTERRSREIAKIQRDIMARRRKKMGLLLVRMVFFVMLPTILAGFYYYKVATPMYATESSFLIIQNEGSGGAGALGGLLPTQFATNSDAIATQGYLQSKDAMLRLDEDLGFKSHFKDENVDPIQRLSKDATNEEAYKMYKKYVKIGYDPTEGMIRMEVSAADGEVSAEFSRRLISYAQERVNNLSQQKRNDTMKDATEALAKAQQTRRDSQTALIKLQIENGLDPEAVIASLRGNITQYETLLIEKDLELSALLDNQTPNRAKVEGVQGDIRRLNQQLEKLNARMTQSTDGENSLAQQAVALQLAQADLANADASLQASNAVLDQARTEAGRQVRYLTVAVDPVASEAPSYPRSFENTLLAFLVFGGIYMMISLTASILREQVTS
ncbi:MAG: capsule biosynthesis protein [Ascidiaceihabitans sp.]|nr:capsule biosynthesis protein [Ascidiaceihabitans sp.]